MKGLLIGALLLQTLHAQLPDEALSDIAGAAGLGASAPDDLSPSLSIPLLPAETTTGPDILDTPAEADPIDSTPSEDGSPDGSESTTSADSSTPSATDLASGTDDNDQPGLVPIIVPGTVPGQSAQSNVDNFEAASDATPTDDTTTDDTTTDDTTADDTTADDTTTDDTTTDDTTADDTTADDTTTDDTTTDDTTIDDTTTDDTSADDTTTDDTTDDTTTDDTTDDTSADDTSADDTSEDDTSTDETLTDENSTDDTSGDDTFVDDTSADDTSADNEDGLGAENTDDGGTVDDSGDEDDTLDDEDGEEDDTLDTEEGDEGADGNDEVEGEDEGEEEGADEGEDEGEQDVDSEDEDIENEDEDTQEDDEDTEDEDEDLYSGTDSSPPTGIYHKNPLANWDGEDNSYYESEDNYGNGPAWEHPEEEDCPEWCKNGSWDEDEDDESPRRGTNIGWQFGSWATSRLRRFAQGSVPSSAGLKGFVWPSKPEGSSAEAVESAPSSTPIAISSSHGQVDYKPFGNEYPYEESTPYPYDSPYDSNTDYSDEGADELPKWADGTKGKSGKKGKKKVRRGKGKCPIKCYGGGESTSSSSAAPIETETPPVTPISSASDPDFTVSPALTTLLTLTQPGSVIPSPSSGSDSGSGSGSGSGAGSGSSSPAGNGGDSNAYAGNSLGSTCPQQCFPFDPAKNFCDSTTTSCVTTGGAKYYCTCRAGYRYDGVNAKDFSKQFKVPGQPYVYGSERASCNTPCSNPLCSEVPVRAACA